MFESFPMPGGDFERKWHAGNIAIVMVGLPATGKTFTARNLSRYLRWLGVKTRTFSVALYRNRAIGEKLNADFFDPSNDEFLRRRTQIADQALRDMISWFKSPNGGQVGILDASNTQDLRRRIILEEFNRNEVKTVFLECVYSHGHEIAVCEHIRELRLTCPEYANAEKEQATEDFNRRLDFYRPYYVSVGSTMEEKDLPFIRLLNGGEKIVVNQLYGYLPSRILYYLMNLHYGSKRIFLYGLPKTTLSLHDYARPAQQYLSTIENCESFTVWTETSLISFAVGEAFKGHQLLTKPQLRGRDLGVIDGKSEEEVKFKFTEEYSRQILDPYYHRYPRAESYHDLAVRLENVMMELERDPHDVLIMADLSVLQCIYAFFLEIPNKEIPKIDISPFSIVELKPKAYGVFERRIEVGCQPICIGKDVFKPFAEHV